MPDDETRETRPLRRQVDEAILLAREAKTEYLRDQIGRDGLQDAIVQLHSVISPWKDDPGVNDIWDEQNLDDVEQLLRQRRQVRDSKKSSAFGGESKKTVRAIQLVSGDKLLDYCDGLLEVAKELGFAPQTTQRTIYEKGTVNDLKWLLTIRNQNPALRDLEPPASPEELQEDDEDEEGVATDGGVAAASTDTGFVPPDQRVARSDDVITSPNGRIPFRGPFFQEIAQRKDEGKDAKITVSSANAETGVGKSTCAYYLAHVLDTTAKGFRTEEKASLSVDEFFRLYDTKPKGSAAILDEAEQLDSRRAMSNKNVDAAEKWQTRRVQEICALLTLPKFEVLDPRMRSLVDYRIEVKHRGEALIYKKSHKKFSGDIWWERMQTFQYPPMDFAPGMDHLHQLKSEYIDGGGGENELKSADEVREEKERLERELEQDKKKSVIKAYARAGLSAPKIADKDDVDVSDRRVRQVLTDEGFEWNGEAWQEADENA